MGPGLVLWVLLLEQLQLVKSQNLQVLLLKELL
mgnify:CR=1 FL=1|jgi:hypothetical protein